MQLAANLRAPGAVVFCDEDSDFRDRRVGDRIDAAIGEVETGGSPRPKGYRDSQWCRAEYLSTLGQGRVAGVPRVIVAAKGSSEPLDEAIRPSGATPRTL